MISLYSGTPGSGKSYHATCKIYDYIRMGKNVIVNYPVDEKFFYSRRGKQRKRYGTLTYCNNSLLTPRYLVEFAEKHHKTSKEGQTVVIIDECSLMFNSRDWKIADRMSWIKFFQMHRHYGYDVILICQHDRMLDRQIRAFIETEYKHRNVKYFGAVGFFLGLIFRAVFVSIEYWYGSHMRIASSFVILRKRKMRLYDTHLII